MSTERQPTPAIPVGAFRLWLKQARSTDQLRQDARGWAIVRDGQQIGEGWPIVAPAQAEAVREAAGRVGLPCALARLRAAFADAGVEGWELDAVFGREG